MYMYIHYTNAAAACIPLINTLLAH